MFNGSSIGQHFRHIYDFYECLLKGIGDGRIDYAKRERDVRIETEPLYAKAAFQKISAQLCDLDENRNFVVLADFSSELNTERPSVESSVGRELMYAYDHAVHHLAIIKMGLKTDCPSFHVAKNIGVAPSTIKHWREEAGR